jgi:hypothetical protein
MGLLAAGATTRAGETLSLLKDMATCQTAEGEDDQPFPLGNQGAGDMGKVFIDFPFADPQGLGKVPGTHFPLA